MKNRCTLRYSEKRKYPQNSLLTEWFDEKNIRTTSNHAKYVLIKNKDFNITILTSMNLNENMRCENFDISTDIEIYNLFNDFVKDLFATQPARFNTR